MKLTKYTHACLLLEHHSGERLIIDPGSFTELPNDLSNIAALIVTEEHYDHFNLENIQKILEKNPQARIFTTEAVSAQLTEAGIENTPVTGQQSETVGNFTLTFTETDHAPVYQHSPCKSLATLVNDFLYYPSDSYQTTEAAVEVLALPTSGPWHKLSEAIDFANGVASKKVLVTHNGLYNDVGNQVSNNFISNNLQDKTREYIYLEDGQTLDEA